MIYDLSPDFGLPGTATNMFYQNGDCSGNNAGGPTIDSGTGEIDLTGATPGVYDYSVLYNLPGDGSSDSCDYARCTDITVTITNQPYIRWDDTFVIAGYYYWCCWNNSISYEGDDCDFNIPIEFIDDLGNPQIAPFDTEITCVYEEPGNPIEQPIGTVNGSKSDVNELVNFTCLTVQAMQDRDVDNSDNDEDIVSKVTLRAYMITENGPANVCNDVAEQDVLIMPNVNIQAPSTLDCANLPNNNSDAADFNFFQFIMDLGDDIGGNTNTFPEVGITSSEAGVTGQYTVYVENVPNCIINQLDAGASEYSIQGNDVIIYSIPDNFDPMLSLNLGACDGGGTGTMTLRGEFEFVVNGIIEYTCFSNSYNFNYDFTTCSCMEIECSGSMADNNRYTTSYNSASNYQIQFFNSSSAERTAFVNCVNDPEGEVLLLDIVLDGACSVPDAIVQKILFTSKITSIVENAAGITIHYDPSLPDPDVACCDTPLTNEVNTFFGTSYVSFPGQIFTDLNIGDPSTDCIWLTIDYEVISTSC